MFDETAWDYFPAKTVSVDGKTVPGVSVLQHGLLAGEVFRQFRTLRRWNALNDLLPDAVAGLVGVHDVGKVNPIFLCRLLKDMSEEERRKWFEALKVDPSVFAEMQNIRHEAVSVAVLRDLDANRTLAKETVGCHHEKEWTPVSGDEAYLGGSPWQSRRVALTREILKELKTDEAWPSPTGTSSEKRVVRKLWAGALVLADWIASRRDVPYPQGEQRELASALLRDAGFDPRTQVEKTDFSELFGYAPRRLQADVGRLYAGPGIYVLEAPTGYGKTEAALALATQALASGDADGLYFALPTQLTSNLAPVGFEERHIGDTPQGRITRVAGRILKAHGQTPLAIHGHEQGYLSLLLCLISEGSLPFKGALGKEEASYLVLTHPLLEALAGGLIGYGGHTWHQQLPYLLLKTETRHDGIHPRSTPDIIHGQRGCDFLLGLHGG